MRISDWSSDVCSSDLLCQHVMRDVFIGFCVHDHKFSTLTSHLRKQIKSYVTGRFRIIQSAVSVFLYDDRVRLTRRFRGFRSEEQTSELQSLMRISYAVFCLKKKKR